jgi:hypothetical protein
MLDKCGTCGAQPSLETWKDGSRTSVYVECACGIITAVLTSKHEDSVIARVVDKYNIRKPRKKIPRSDFLSCFCGSKNISLEKFETTCYIMCYECFRTTEEGNADGTDKTLAQATELWNREHKENKGE